jgi:pyrimidine-nucleoside phosphorylase
MDEPLGTMVGNFLEIEETLDCLEGKGPTDLMEVSLALAARMAVLGGRARDVAEGRGVCEAALAGGTPRRLFLESLRCQGGNPEQVLAMRGTYRSTSSAIIQATQEGYISRIDAGKVGHGGILLGVGRNRTEDRVSPTAGVQFHKKRGDRVQKGEPVMTLWAVDDSALASALPGFVEALDYAAVPPPPRQLVLKEIR